MAYKIWIEHLLLFFLQPVALCVSAIPGHPYVSSHVLSLYWGLLGCIIVFNLCCVVHFVIYFESPVWEGGKLVENS